MVDAIDQAHAAAFVNLFDLVQIEDQITRRPNARYAVFGNDHIFSGLPRRRRRRPRRGQSRSGGRCAAGGAVRAGTDESSAAFFAASFLAKSGFIHPVARLALGAGNGDNAHDTTGSAAPRTGRGASGVRDCSLNLHILRQSNQSKKRRRQKKEGNCAQKSRLALLRAIVKSCGRRAASGGVGWFVPPHRLSSRLARAGGQRQVVAIVAAWRTAAYSFALLAIGWVGNTPRVRRLFQLFIHNFWL